jgi:hypothetical protein
LAAFLRTGTKSTDYLNGAKVAAEGLLTEGGFWGGYRFNMGYGDADKALDAQTWGALFLLGLDLDETWVGSLLTTLSIDNAEVHNRAREALDYAESHFAATQTSVLGSNEVATGYSPYIEPAAHDDVNDHGAVWSEGSYGAAMASIRLAAETSETTTMSDGAAIILGLNPLVDTDGSVIYAADKHDVGQSSTFYPYGNAACVAWRMMACSSNANTAFWSAKAATYNSIKDTITAP